MGVETRDPLAPPIARYQLHLDAEGCDGPVLLTENSMGQLARLIDVPIQVMEKVPASVAVAVVRSMLAAAAEKTGRNHLFRLRTARGRTFLRAILPSNFVRVDDQEVLQTLRGIASPDLRVISLSITEDLFNLRIVFPKEANDIGSARVPDLTYPGVDLRASETGQWDLRVARLLFRLICSNGLTSETHAKERSLRKSGRFDRPGFQAALREALETAVGEGRKTALLMADAKHAYVRDPAAEMERVFREYQLGSPRSRAGRWVREEIIPSFGLLGVRRFDFVNAFTAVAQRLEHGQRVKFEDAMTAYLAEAASRN